MSKSVVAGYPSLVCSPIVSQVLAVIIRGTFFHSPPPPPPPPHLHHVLLNPDTVSQVLTSIPRLFFHPPHSIGNQKSFFSHTSPSRRRRNHSSDHPMVSTGLRGALEFYNWLDSHSHFSHTEATCRDMACILAMVCSPKIVWGFLKSMVRRRRGLVTTSTITCLIKFLGEEEDGGLSILSKMKRLHCEPDVVTYNTIIHVLCRSGKLWKARLLLRKMELPWSRCPPDALTYTTLITFYCRRSVMAGGGGAERRGMWDANRLFRTMVSRGGLVLDTAAFNSFINGCCRTGRLGRALELVGEMRRRGCTPNRVTFNSFIRFYSRVNQVEEALSLLRRMEGCGVTPTSSSYTPVIHGLCEAGRVMEASDLMDELVRKGSVPREYTYWLVSSSVADTNSNTNTELRREIENRIEQRRRRLTKLKPGLRWWSYFQDTHHFHKPEQSISG